MSNRPSISGNGCPAHIPDLPGVVKAATPVHGLAIVPDNKIMQPPFVNVHKNGMGRVLGEVTQ